MLGDLNEGRFTVLFNLVHGGYKTGTKNNIPFTYQVYFNLHFTIFFHTN